jgi:hypothetical protein
LCECLTITSLKTILHALTTIEVKNDNLGSICVNVSLLQSWEPFLHAFTTVDIKSDNLCFICVNASLV